ncbi:MAG: adenylate/guanylate cyclase domain-containing protein, partial [Pseudomonadota bacterium]
IGDAIMALFPLTPINAYNAAIDMNKTLRELNTQYAGQIPQLKIGIGIHYGSAMLGIVGQKHRLEGTVISSAVNTAAHVESLTKQYKCSVLTTKDTIAQLARSQPFKFRFVDHAFLKSSHSSIELYQLIDAEEEFRKQLLSNYLPLYAYAVKTYKENDQENALKALEEYLDKIDNDFVASRLYNTIKALQNSTPKPH